MFQNCKFCRKQIEDYKLTLHQMYCEKNCIRCDRCGQFYDKNEQELHDIEFHQLQWCQVCKTKVQDPRKHICSNRQTKCDYCSLQLPHIDYQDHEKTCGSRTLRCNHCSQYVMMRDIQYHLQICHAIRPKQEDQRQKNITIQEMNNPQFNQSSNYSQGQALPYQDPQQMYQQSIGLKPSLHYSEIQDDQYQAYKLSMEYMEMQRLLRDSKNNSVLPQGTNTSQTQSQEYSQYEMEQKLNALQNQQLQQQLQQNQNNQNKNLNRMDNQGRTFQQVQNSSGKDFQSYFTKDQYINDNTLMGNPKMDQGLKNQMQVNQNKQTQPQQMKQENEKKKIFEDRNSQSKDAKNSINDIDNGESIIGRILLESIQADQLQMSYAQYKQHQKLQKEIESRRQEQPKPNIPNQNQASHNDEEFYYLSDQERIQQRLLMEQIQNKRY
ncbi:unnamed protein product (macronuclear) [Paramecium tetraurelia]|uniref:TRAFD1/XAF1 zinc finger domain-containing protein n=1 Tax=Paramecium tetraurelia TaxID=5888 RepID=A0DS46_PARTE|nr:uncharacterized protein GSPATT00019567001 [Paramecium tetraurelia]CAK85863.1 unnamed protein product [Paramecium tetraurelia]|eukprot:XP_001453260.1 hypothetical protein (macronuclear) [Paramecium tetraurelia strain d4-2]